MDFRVRSPEFLVPSLGDNLPVADDDAPDHRIRMYTTGTASRQLETSLHERSPYERSLVSQEARKCSYSSSKPSATLSQSFERNGLFVASAASFAESIIRRVFVRASCLRGFSSLRSFSSPSLSRWYERESDDSSSLPRCSARAIGA